ncbi:MAG TPA: hypothetical protein VHV08_08880 [Pirellulales bacterium]|jgi:hypothetical protein|nr:hypothetical protein [Pirellulales bacterium]
MNRTALWATSIVVVNEAINFIHGQAHERLAVGLQPWQWAFVWTVIVVAPLVAAALYWTRWRQAGAALLCASMLGSLLFGVFHHFVAVSPDHVSHLPAGDAQGLFIVTAVLLVIAEALGAALAFWQWTTFRRSRI